jgi:hypothetical protein
MTRKRCLAVLASTGLAVLQAREAVADSGRCFDFVSPTLEKLLAPGKVQRLFIQVKDPSPEARRAAASLSGEAKRRGIAAVLSAEAWNANGKSEQDHAVRLCKENRAQLVASVQFLTGTEAARVEFWDQAGKSEGSLAGWMTEEVSCPPVLPGPGEPVASSPPSYAWYGWEMLPVDAASFLLVIYVKDTPGVGAATYATVPPAIHLANERIGRAAISFGLRLVPAALTAASPRCARSDEDGCGLIVLALASGLLVSLVDDFVLAWKPSDTGTHTTDPQPPSKPPGLSVSVGLLPYRQGAGLGLAGRF